MGWGIVLCRWISRALVGAVVMGLVSALAPVAAIATAGSNDDQQSADESVAASAIGQAGGGYWMLGADGKVFGFGDARTYGEPSAVIAAAPQSTRAVDLEAVPGGNGYWILDSTGRVFAYGAARDFGGIAGQLNPGELAASLSSTASGQGYWVFTDRGRAVGFGDAVAYGDMSAVPLNGPILDSVVTATGNGYFMVASDGGIFAFGDAAFHGSMGGVRLNAPVQGLVPAGDNSGYWLVASDGGVFAFDAPFLGSMGAVRLNQPIRGMVRYGDGYLMVAADGGIFDFSSKPYVGSLGSTPPAAPVVSVAAVPDVLAADQTRVLSANAVVDATTINGGTALFVTQAQAQSVDVGDYVAVGTTAATPNGLLGAVTGVSLNGPGGTAIVTTLPATLDEVFPAGDVEIDTQLGTDANGDDTVAPAGFLGALRRAFDTIKCSNVNDLSFQGSSISVSPTVSGRFQWAPHRFATPMITLDASATATMTLAVTASTARQCHASGASPPINLPPFPIPGTPLVFTPRVQLLFDADVNAQASAQLTSTFAADLGISVTCLGVSCSKNTTAGLRHVATNVSGGVDLSVDLSMGPNIDLFVNNVAGPSIMLRGNLHGQISASPSQVCGSVTGGATLGAGFHVRLWRFSIDADLPGTLGFTRQLYGACTQRQPVTPPTTGGGQTPPTIPPTSPPTTPPTSPPTSPKPGPSVSLSKSGSAQGKPGCSSSACAYLTINGSNFAPNSRVTVVCSSSLGANFFNYTVPTNGAGAFSTTSCYFGYPGRSVWVDVNGVRSNTVVW
jgi:hypothetical protein